MVEEGLLVTLEDGAGHDRGEPGAEPTPAEVGMRAHRTDLAEPPGRESLTGHGDQAVAVERADVPAELDGADRERAGPGELHQGEHLADVVGSQRACPEDV